MPGHGRAPPPCPGQPRGFLPCVAPCELPSLSQELRQGCLTPSAPAELEQNDSPFPLLEQETPGQPLAGSRIGLQPLGHLPAAPGMPTGPGGHWRDMSPFLLAQSTDGRRTALPAACPGRTVLLLPVPQERGIKGSRQHPGWERGAQVFPESSGTG